MKDDKSFLNAISSSDDCEDDCDDDGCEFDFEAKSKGMIAMEKGCDAFRFIEAETSDSTVTASFQIYTTDIHNFVAQVNITPFTMEGLKDWAV